MKFTAEQIGNFLIPLAVASFALGWTLGAIVFTRKK
jgi:hypothetical protein